MVRRVRNTKSKKIVGVPSEIIVTDDVPTNEQRKKWWKELSDIVGFTVPTDGLISVVHNKLSIDIIKFDDLLGKKIPLYDAEKCLYKGKKSSMRDVMLSVYGERAVKLTELLIP